MHRTQIYLQTGLYRKLQQRAKKGGITLSEAIRRALENDLQRSPGDDAREYFVNFQPLERLAEVDAVEYQTTLRKANRKLRPLVE